MDHLNDVRRMMDLIGEIATGMLTTQCDDGTIHSRPMITLQQDCAGDLWFFVSARAHASEDVRKTRKVCISYASPGLQHFVSVSGIGELVDDGEMKRKLWNSLFEAWFPAGPDDTDVKLLRVEIERAEVWESPASPPVHLTGFGEARAAGLNLQAAAATHGTAEITEQPSHATDVQFT